MKTTLIVLLMLFTINVSGQWMPKADWKTFGIKCGLMFASGSLKGAADVVTHHYPAFDKRFPHANQQWFNQDLSWRNKYANGLPEDGPRFIGSTTVFVWWTDAQHGFTALSNACTVAAVTIPICGPKRSWKLWLLDAIAYYISYNLGFSFVYEVVFPNR